MYVYGKGRNRPREIARTNIYICPSRTSERLYRPKRRDSNRLESDVFHLVAPEKRIANNGHGARRISHCPELVPSRQRRRWSYPITCDERNAQLTRREVSYTRLCRNDTETRLKLCGNVSEPSAETHAGDTRKRTLRTRRRTTWAADRTPGD